MKRGVLLSVSSFWWVLWYILYFKVNLCVNSLIYQSWLGCMIDISSIIKFEQVICDIFVPPSIRTIRCFSGRRYSQINQVTCVLPLFYYALFFSLMPFNFCYSMSYSSCYLLHLCVPFCPLIPLLLSALFCFQLSYCQSHHQQEFNLNMAIFMLCIHCASKSRV